jgi:hypothetical protein
MTAAMRKPTKAAKPKAATKATAPKPVPAKAAPKSRRRQSWATQDLQRHADIAIAAVARKQARQRRKSA